MLLSNCKHSYCEHIFHLILYIINHTRVLKSGDSEILILNYISIRVLYAMIISYQKAYHSDIIMNFTYRYRTNCKRAYPLKELRKETVTSQAEIQNPNLS